MVNKLQEALRRLVFDVEQEVKRTVVNSYVQSPQVLVNRTNSAGDCGIGVELIANVEGWHLFVDTLMAKGVLVETRRWVSFGEGLSRYDLYVENK